MNGFTSLNFNNMTSKYSIGIDISKKDIKACIVAILSTGEQKVKASRTFLNTLKGFAAFTSWYQKHQKEASPMHFVLEATGTYHEALAWHLYQQEQSVHIVLANRAKDYRKSQGFKSKNDKTDAKALAYMGANCRLEEWLPLSKAIYDLRSITRFIESLQKLKTSLSNQLEAATHSMYTLETVCKGLKATLKQLTKQIEKAQAKVVQLIEEDEKLKEKVAYMTSIKGIGVQTAAVVIAETNGFALVKNQKQLTSYAGYDVAENQSGKRVGKTHISKKGNAHIRRILHLAAFNAVRHQKGNFKALYERVYERSNIKMKAYVAVQAKLLRMMYTLWKKGAYFDTNYHNKAYK